MNDSFDKFNQAWIRGLILLVAVGIFGLVFKRYKKIEPGDWKWFILISLAGGLNQAPYYFGFEHLTIGTATLLFYVSLVVGAYILGYLFFGEKLTRVKLAALGLAIIGLGIMYSLTLTSEQFLPALSTIVAGLLGSAGVVFSKKISGTYSETQVLTGYFVVMFPLNLCLSLWVGEPTPHFALTVSWLALLMYGLVHLIANATVVAGFKFLEPSIGGLLGTLEVVFAAILGIVFFSEALTPEILLGSAVILLSVVLPDISTMISKRQ